MSLKPGAHVRLAGAVRQLNRFFGLLSVRSITIGTCHDWEIKRGEKLSASAFNTERLTLKAILNQAISEGLLMDNPALAIKRRKLPRHKLVIPSHEQFKILVDQIRAADCRATDAANLMEILAYSGMRVSEAVSMRWSDVDFKRGAFMVTGGENGTKNHEARVVPLFPSLKILLEKLKEELDPVVEERIIPIDTARKAISTACVKANLPNCLERRNGSFQGEQFLPLRGDGW